MLRILKISLALLITAIPIGTFINNLLVGHLEALEVKNSAISQELFRLNSEENYSKFILETRKIEIPNYPHAFNPSIIKYENGYLMSFRFDNQTYKWIKKIGVVFLDENFSPVEKPYVLNTRVQNPMIPSKAEDARLFIVNDRYYIIYNDNEENTPNFGTYRYMYLSELIFTTKRFYILNPEKLFDFPTYLAPAYKMTQCEKNWVPFDYQGTLLLGYSLDPHRIYYPVPHTGKCEEIASTSHTTPRNELNNWNWGNFRGGTPAINIDGQYVAFFHSHQKIIYKNKLRDFLFMGAYTFDADPPFAIRTMSPQPIIAKGFYENNNHFIFPAGIIDDGDFIWVTYGRKDCEIWIAKIDKKALLESLVSVSYSD